MQDTKPRTELQEKEVDLGVFFTAIGKVFTGIGAFFKEIFRLILFALFGLLMLIKRNIAWFALGAAIGFSWGLYQYTSHGPSYYSDMVVSPNFASSRLLYQKIDYFNALVREGKTAELSQTFGLNAAEAGKLISFAITPVDDPLQGARMYREQFLDYRHNMPAGSDSTWNKTMSYTEFVAKLTKYDYPLQTVRVYSRSATLYPKIQEGLLRSIRENPSMKQARKAMMDMLNKEEQILSSSLTGIDSLRKAYNQRLLRQAENGTGSSTSILLGNTPQVSPEIDLYDKELMLKDEYLESKRRSMEQQEILQVYSDFNAVGTKVPKLDEDIIRLPLLAMLVVLILVLAVELFRYLNRLEKKKATA